MRQGSLFFVALFFDTEDGDEMFLRNVGHSELHGGLTSEIATMYTSLSFQIRPILLPSKSFAIHYPFIIQILGAAESNSLIPVISRTAHFET
jgi:hypothetical protein